MTVTEKNTKKDILAAYKEAKAEVKKLKAKKVGNSADVQRAKVGEAVGRASSTSVEGIVADLGKLRVNANGTISNLEEQILAKKTVLDDLNVAIDTRTQDLQDLHGVVAEADSLAILMEAQAKEKAEFEADMEEQRAELERERLQSEADHKEVVAARKKLWDRQQEEYKYDFDLRKKRFEEEFKDHKATVEKELTVQRETLVADMEQFDKEKEEYSDRLKDLLQQVQDHPVKVGEEVKNAVGKAVSAEKARHNYEVGALNRELKTKDAIHTSEVGSLKDRIDNLIEENKHLRTQLDSANLKVQTIASEAVKSSQPRIVQAVKESA